MSGPNPPERDPEEPLDHSVDDSTGIPAPGETGAYSQAYSAPASELVTGLYVPADPRLYDDGGFDRSSGPDTQRGAPRWPWVVGVAAIVAAIALVVSVSLLVARNDTTKLANPGTSTVSTPPPHDEMTTTVAPPATTNAPPPPPPSPETPTAEPTTAAPAPPPAPTSAAPPATPAAAPPPTTTAPAGPRQVTYSVTGTKAPGDVISVTYVDASGRRRTQHNVYIPWSMTVTPISQSDVGSLEASSLFRVSRLNCAITTNDGTVLSSNNNDSAQTSC